tara:strand:+ start:1096 stop:1263 length:168 start_codon:yes stop_codon:yes gene_type:complete
MNQEKFKTCVLCKEEYTGWGNNPEPLEHPAFKCCNVCNISRVIPARMAELYSRGA